MEIDRAVSESTDRRLQTKYSNAVYVIQRAFALYEFEQVAFSFNGGKDSTVLLHLLRAGYYLHKSISEYSNGNLSDSKLKIPIRTIYFESPDSFPEIDIFTYETATTYELHMETIRTDFKSGLEDLLKKKPTKAIFLGTRIGDPNADGQEQFSPSSAGWPPFMRVNPILDWSYRDVWAFILTCKVPYCSLYDKGYTSIGSIHDTVPNAFLVVADSTSPKETFKPAYMLADGRLERVGREKKIPIMSDENSLGNDIKNVAQSSSFLASIIVVGDENLFDTGDDKLGTTLCKKLYAIGWKVTRMVVVQNDIDSVSEEIKQQKAKNDMVFLFGGLAPMHLDISLSCVAKAFGVQLVPHEKFEDLRDIIGKQCTGDHNEMNLLPEGITELLQHKKLPMPLIKCQNVIVLAATNVCELEIECDCLLEIRGAPPLKQLATCVSKHLSTMLSDVETAQTLSKLCLGFPDLYIGFQRKSRFRPLVVSFSGKDKERIESAATKLSASFPAGAFTEVDRVD